MEIVLLEVDNKLLEPDKKIIIKTLLDIVYEACVYSDILNGEKNGEAARYIIQNNKSKVEQKGEESFFTKIGVQI